MKFDIFLIILLNASCIACQEQRYSPAGSNEVVFTTTSKPEVIEGHCGQTCIILAASGAMAVVLLCLIIALYYAICKDKESGFKSKEKFEEKYVKQRQNLTRSEGSDKSNSTIDDEYNRDGIRIKSSENKKYEQVSKLGKQGRIKSPDYGQINFAYSKQNVRGDSGKFVNRDQNDRKKIPADYHSNEDYLQSYSANGYDLHPVPLYGYQDPFSSNLYNNYHNPTNYYNSELGFHDHDRSSYELGQKQSNSNRYLGTHNTQNEYTRKKKSSKSVAIDERYNRTTTAYPTKQSRQNIMYEIPQVRDQNVVLTKDGQPKKSSLKKPNSLPPQSLTVAFGNDVIDRQDYYYYPSIYSENGTSIYSEDGTSKVAFTRSDYEDSSSTLSTIYQDGLLTTVQPNMSTETYPNQRLSTVRFDSRQPELHLEIPEKLPWNVEDPQQIVLSNTDYAKPQQPLNLKIPEGQFHLELNCEKLQANTHQQNESSQSRNLKPENEFESSTSFSERLASVQCQFESEDQPDTSPRHDVEGSSNSVLSPKLSQKQYKKYCSAISDELLKTGYFATSIETSPANYPEKTFEEKYLRSNRDFIHIG